MHPQPTIHVLYKRIGNTVTVPVLVIHDFINEATKKNEVLGVALIESTRQDRHRVLTGVAKSCAIDPTLLLWRNMNPDPIQA